MNVKIPPNAVDIHGVPHLKDAKGNWVPVANIRPADLIMNEMVVKVRAYAEDLSAEIARFQAHSYADIAGFDALLAQEYNIEPAEGTKGNRTFISFDGCTQVKVAVSDRIVLGPELQSAKAILDAIIIERGEGVDPFLVGLVKQAFKVDQEGKVDVHSILALRRMQVEDPRWENFCRAIDDSVRVVGSKRYLRIYSRPTNDGKWEMIPLDMASVEPTPAAFERRSLRRQVEDMQKTTFFLITALTETRMAIDKAMDAYVNGDMPSMLKNMEMSRNIVNFNLGLVEIHRDRMTAAAR